MAAEDPKEVEDSGCDGGAEVASASGHGVEASEVGQLTGLKDITAEAPKDVEDRGSDGVAATASSNGDEASEARLLEGRPEGTMEQASALEISNEDLAAKIAATIRGRDLSTLSTRQVRSEVEQGLGLAPGALDVRRSDVAELIKAEVMRSQKAPEEAAVTTPEKERHPRRTRSPRNRPRRGRKRRWSVSSGEEGAAKGVEEAQDGDAVEAEEVPLSVQVAGEAVSVPVKRFNSGKWGFYTTARLTVEHDGVKRDIQCQINCVVLDVAGKASCNA